MEQVVTFGSVRWVRQGGFSDLTGHIHEYGNDDAHGMSNEGLACIVERRIEHERAEFSLLPSLCLW